MDTIGVSVHNMKMRRESKRRSPGKTGAKVVDISSPMKVKTSASEFRATVQELTARDSDVARLMESTNEATCHHSRANITSHLSSISNYGEEQHQSRGTLYCSSDDAFTGEYFNHAFKKESPGESDPLLVEGFDGNLYFSMPRVERSLGENKFPLVFQESAWLDVLN